MGVSGYRLWGTEVLLARDERPGGLAVWWSHSPPRSHSLEPGGQQP